MSHLEQREKFERNVPDIIRRLIGVVGMSESGKQLAEYEQEAHAHHSVTVRLADDWELMVWYAPTAGSSVIREMNGGYGYLWRQLYKRTDKHGKVQERVVRDTQRGAVDDFPLREDCVRFLRGLEDA